MKKAIILFGLLILTFPGLFAESITLEQARSMALANSRSLAKFNLAIKSTALDEKTRIYNDYIPTPSLGAGASVNLWNAQGSAPVTNPFDTFSANGRVSVSQNIFQGGRTLVQKAINALASESARKDAQSEYFNVLDSTDSAYYAVLDASASLAAAESALETSTASLNIAELRYTNGMINQADYLQALADKESKENSRNQAKRTLALSTSKLKILINANFSPQPQDIDFSEYEDLIQRLGSTTDDDFDLLYNQFFTLVSAANPALAKSMLASKMAEENVKMAQRGYSPSLDMSFSTGLNYTKDGGMTHNAGTLSLNATIPVDFWVTANNVEKSKISRDQAALDYASQGDQLVTNLQSALMNALSNAGSVLSSRRAVDYAVKNFELIQEGYRLNKNSIQDLGTASDLLYTSRNNLITAQYGFLQSLSTLRSLGAMDDEQKLMNMLMGN